MGKIYLFFSPIIENIKLNTNYSCTSLSVYCCLYRMTLTWESLLKLDLWQVFTVLYLACGLLRLGRKYLYLILASVTSSSISLCCKMCKDNLICGSVSVSILIRGSILRIRTLKRFKTICGVRLNE